MKTTPKERPILFSTPMVQAILQGYKTETRRVIKPQPDGRKIAAGRVGKRAAVGPFIELCEAMNYPKPIEPGGEYDKVLSKFKYNPYGEPGDLLWVRETHSVFKQGDGSLQREKTKYKADPQWCGNDLIKWKPSIHMPKVAARIWLEIESIKAQRVHELTTEEIIAEGLRIPVNKDGEFVMDMSDGGLYDCMSADYWLPSTTPQERKDIVYKALWRQLWTSINGAASWHTNPWVWAVRYRVLSTNGRP